MPEGLVVFGQKGFDLLNGFHRDSPFSILRSASGSVLKGFVVGVQQRFDFLDDLHESPSFLPPGFSAPVVFLSGIIIIHV